MKLPSEAPRLEKRALSQATAHDLDSASTAGGGRSAKVPRVKSPVATAHARRIVSPIEIDNRIRSLSPIPGQPWPEGHESAVRASTLFEHRG
jgi:hypothetical protein